jgi:hypothetical protein
MNILETIIAQKKMEVAQRKIEVPAAMLEKGRYFNRTTSSLRK